MLEKSVLDYIVKAEGGYVNHPKDKGGPTNYGITQATLAEARGKSVTAADVKNLSLDEASRIYQARYYDKMRLDYLNGAHPQLAIMDQGVNRGTSTAITMAQVTANSLGAKLDTDGRMGPNTAKAINGLNPELFCREFIQLAQHGYVDIVKRNNSQLTFLSGWLNRTHNLQDLIWNPGTVVDAPVIVVPKPELVIPVVPKKELNPLLPYQLAKEELGVKEIAGKAAEARIVLYHSFTTLKATSDEVPWCSSFMCFVVESAGYKSTKSAAAKSWQTWGVEGDGSVGDIACFTRTGGNHVGFVAEKYKKKSGKVMVLGGTQSNRVSIAAQPESRLVGFRRPA